MKVLIGSDHRGCDFKKKILSILETQGYDVQDVGTHDPDVSCDYPEVAFEVATQVAQSSDARGILVCMSGIGQAIAANKVRGAYAALCYNAEAAALSRQHNNANILVLGAKFVNLGELEKILEAWFKAEFEGGRHLKRVNQIKAIEKGV